MSIHDFTDLPGFHRPSYRLGMIAAFAEAVASGVKRLGLGPPMAPADLQDLLGAAEAIGRSAGVELRVEDDFPVTDLFPAGVARGKHVILIARDRAVLVEYGSVKARAAGATDPDDRRAVARALGRLLSYPDDRIDQMIARRLAGS
jgi:hypothetical protein